MRVLALLALVLAAACGQPTAPSPTFAKAAASSGTDFTWICAGLACTFDATPHSGSVASRTWDFGDGAVGQGDNRLDSNIDHTYATAGTYTVYLSVLYRTPTLHVEVASHAVTVAP